MWNHKIIILFIELPDSVCNITFTEITKSSAHISWTFVGEAFHYTTDFNGCSKSNIFPIDTNQTSVILRGLDVSTQYNISVTVNNITQLTKHSLYKFFVLHTRAGGMKCQFLKLLKLAPDPTLWNKSSKVYLKFLLEMICASLLLLPSVTK